jgi:sugar (pentulose or hexulose) kinase
VSVLAIDIGSSRIKALSASWDGRLLDVDSTATPRLASAAGEMAYPADAVQAAIEGLVKAACARHDQLVDTLVFSCLGTAMVPSDAAGRPLGPALAPADARPIDGAGLDSSVDLTAAELRHMTGSDPAVASFLLHFLWWQRTRPELMVRLHRFRSLRGFAMAELCGVDAEDPSWASRTMLYDLEANSWSETILSASGLPGEKLPPLRPSTSAWPVKKEMQERLGLAPGAVAVLGAMDNCCSLLGATSPGASGLVNIVGTYEHMAAAGSLEEVRKASASADGIVHAYLIPGRYIGMTRVPIGDLLSAVAASSSTGLDQLLDGARPDPEGLVIDLDVASVQRRLDVGVAPADVLQALLEASAAVLGRFADAWPDEAGGSSDVIAVGGGAARAAVLQLKANLLGRRIFKLTSDEAAGLGALRLAAMAIEGLSPSSACARFPNPITATLHPRGAPPTSRQGDD